MFMVHKANRRPGRKLLGVDLGERWVGVAGTDDTGVLASPIETLDLRRTSLESVARIATEQNVAAIVVGLPRNMSGSEGFQAKKARVQASELQELTSVPIIFWDERLSTAIAEQIAARRKRRRSAKAEPPDALAAAVLLQGYVDANPYRSRPGRSR